MVLNKILKKQPPRTENPKTTATWQHLHTK